LASRETYDSLGLIGNLASQVSDTSKPNFEGDLAVEIRKSFPNVPTVSSHTFVRQIFFSLLRESFGRKDSRVGFRSTRVKHARKFFHWVGLILGVISI